jgi:predicted amidophosphoribosyltransferase
MQQNLVKQPFNENASDPYNVGCWQKFVLELPRAVSIRTRHDCKYFTLRAWKSNKKIHQIEFMKLIKLAPPKSFVRFVANEMSRFLSTLIGHNNKMIITSVPSGHSKTSNCLASILAQRIASNLKTNYVKLWLDRPMPGSSYPRPLSERPNLEWIVVPKLPVVIIDDIVTSGSHMEECLTAVRAVGVGALGLAWIGGEKR